ncbi:MAG: hypothetical protein R3D29_14410 [Nitratireductor sp.]
MSDKSRYDFEAGEVEALLGRDNRGWRRLWYLPAQKPGMVGQNIWLRAFPVPSISILTRFRTNPSALPHMPPTPEKFGAAMGALGVSRDDDIIVYDGLECFLQLWVWREFSHHGSHIGTNSMAVLTAGKPMVGPLRPERQAPQKAVFEARPDLTRVRALARCGNLEIRQCPGFRRKAFCEVLGTAPNHGPDCDQGIFPVRSRCRLQRAIRRWQAETAR